MLIVVAVIAVLAGIIIPNMRGLIGTGKPEAAKAELAAVQTAMDNMLESTGLTQVTAVTTPTNDMSQFPKEHPLFRDFLATQTTTGKYTCTSSGVVTQVTTGY